MTDKEINQFLGIMGFIALRKSEFYNYILSELGSEELTESQKIQIQNHISDMGNESFLSVREKKEKKIDSSTKLKNLDLDPSSILNEVKRKDV